MQRATEEVCRAHVCPADHSPVLRQHTNAKLCVPPPRPVLRMHGLLGVHSLRTWGCALSPVAAWCRALRLDFALWLHPLLCPASCLQNPQYPHLPPPILSSAARLGYSKALGRCPQVLMSILRAEPRPHPVPSPSPSRVSLGAHSASTELLVHPSCCCLLRE